MASGGQPLPRHRIHVDRIGSDRSRPGPDACPHAPAIPSHTRFHTGAGEPADGRIVSEPGPRLFKGNRPGKGHRLFNNVSPFARYSRAALIRSSPPASMGRPRQPQQAFSVTGHQRAIGLKRRFVLDVGRELLRRGQTTRQSATRRSITGTDSHLNLSSSLHPHPGGGSAS